VIIALLGLVALGLGSLQGVALARALTVLTTMAASLVLLPALPVIFGKRIQRHLLRHAAKGKVEGRRWRALAAEEAGRAALTGFWCGPRACV
jgi:putative drug exporter of the RND superfamily